MSYEYFDSLSLPQRKLIQNIKDILDEENNAGRKTHFVFCRKIPVIGEDQYQIMVNNIDKNINNQVLSPYIYKDKPLNLEEFNEPVQEPEEEDIAEVATFETIRSNNFTINEKLKYNKRITNIECDIPADGLRFNIKFQKKFNVKTIGIRFLDGNVSSYKFDFIFIDENNKIISELKSQRNARVTSLMEFYMLQNTVRKVDRMVINIVSKHNLKDIVENIAKIGDVIISDHGLDEGMMASKMVSAIEVENQASNSSYANHPSLVELRVNTNEAYPKLYEMESQSVYTQFKNLNEKEIKVYGSVLNDNIVVSNDAGNLIRIGNKDLQKYPDDTPIFSLSVLEKKGTIKYGGFKNHLVAFRFIPIEIDPKWDITLVTRGGDMEDDNPNNFHAILKMNNEGFSFTRQLVENKGDKFDEEILPMFPLKIEREQELSVMIYQFNVSEKDVQYYIYIKKHNDVEWKLYQQFLDSPKLKGENYGEQTIFWGGMYDYIFFNGIKKMKLTDLTVGELVTPIRKVE
jgi:hypothetical protein